MDWPKFRKRLFKIIGHLIIDIAIIILLVFAVFYFFEDEIKNELLAVMNQSQIGEVEIETIDLSIFKYFPLISLQLSDVNYYENKLWQNSGSSLKICQLNDMYFSMNVIDLIQGIINVEKLNIEGGQFNIIVHPDSSINLLNALGAKSSQEDTARTDIILSNVSINDLVVNYKNTISQQEASVKLDSLTNNFTFRKNIILCQLEFSGWIKMLSLGNDFYLENQRVRADLDFIFNIDSLNGHISDSKIQVEDLILLTSGTFGLYNDYLAEVDLELSDENIELLEYVFSNRLIRDQKSMLTQGTLYGDGHIKWKSFDDLPIIDFKFGFNDLNLVLPRDTTLSVYFDFDGNFYTGQNPDLSEMKLELTDIQIRLPGGQASGSFFLSDWQKPAFDLKMNADLDITGYENIFNINEVDSLFGRIKVITDLSGNYNKATNKLNYQRENGNIALKDLSFSLARWNQKIYKLDGKLNQTAHTIKIDEASIISSSGDLKLKGEFTNLISYLFKGSKNFTGNLQANSNKLDLSKLFGPDDVIVKVIGTKAHKFNIDFAIDTRLESDTLAPKTILKIKKCGGKLTQYPDVHSLTGELTIQDEKLDFKNLQLKTDSGNLIFNGDLKFTQTSIVDLNSSIYLKDFYINKFTSKNPNADIIRLDILGNFIGRMSILSQNIYDYLNLEEFSVDGAKFYYLNQTTEDTVDIQGLKMDLDHVAINVTDGDKILSTLDVLGNYKSRQLIVNSFKYNNFITSVEGKTGKIGLSENKIELFGIHGEMIIDVDFTDDVYTYRIEQKVKGHDINHILDSVTENDLVDGLLDISFWVEMRGNTWQEILRTMRGELSNRGKNLRIKKIDIDTIVEKFKDTQNFKLLDVGAFVFAGPAGAVVTKSVDYATLLRMNPGDSTVINDFISELEIKDGIIHFEDMAFSTEQNRIVFNGDIDLVNMSFVNFVIAFVNEDGCIVLSQQLNGPFSEPTLEEFSAISTILAPITNAYNSIVGNDCTPFYTGAIAHPN
jgi:hypothetical protein